MKIISILLIHAILFSCSRHIIIDQNVSVEYLLEKNEEIIIQTHNDNLVKFYRPYTYKFENDTIYADLSTTSLSQTIKKEKVKIALTDIKYIKERKQFSMIWLVIGLWISFIITYYLQNQIVTDK